MNKKIWLVVVLIVIIIAIAYFMKSDPAVTTDGQTGAVKLSENGELVNGMMSKKSSLKGLLGMTGSQRCDFTDVTEVAETSGTVYVSGGKMRGDFTAISAGNTVASHMITRDNAVHVWGDDLPQGMMMPVTELGSTNGVDQGFDANKEVDYSCEPWTEDASVFELPASVTFMNMNEMMKALPGSMMIPEAR